ncbi:hypothetical protein G9272_29310 [Streptomyces asoensis]|uniref:Uncharacterized protein n=1 Tax=Streptomyces asoensis TaxID=249586 RepID=A0A6M4WTP9_9ACTN|nr:hypothetical protein [Streptomyces asoensis]QJT03874.1 hypothetical protein G9272_29310 [Streptomyces asoensis]
MLFKIYLNPGYRLAHRMDPGSFADLMGLSGANADLVRNLSPSEAEQFADGLKWKQLDSLNVHMPTTYRWLQTARPEILREFQENSTFSRLAQWGGPAKQLVDFVRECHDFYDGVPAALSDVAQLEFLLMSARREQEMRSGRTDGSAPAPSVFSWASLYWKPSYTSLAHFSVDAFAILLGKKEMVDEGDPIWVVIAPSHSGRMPTILRVAEPAYRLLGEMGEPVTAGKLLEYAREQGLNVSAQALQALLSRLAQSRAIGSYHLRDENVGV